MECLNTTTKVHSVCDIPHVSESEYIPDKTVQAHQHIRCQIDIIGFKDVVKINGIEYTNGTNPIIFYDVWDEGLKSKTHFTNNNLDFIKVTDERIIEDGLNTTLEIDVYLKWHHSTKRSRTVCGILGCRTYTWISKEYYHEYATFSDYIVTPVQYTTTQVPVVSVTVYNDTVVPRSIICLTPTNNSIGYRLLFNNESIEYYHNVLLVESKDNGVAYGNFTEVHSQSIYDESDMFSRIGNTILLNSTEINDNFKIYLITPYEEIPINFTVSNYSRETKLTNMEMSSLFGILLLGWFIVCLINRIRNF